MKIHDAYPSSFLAQGDLPPPPQTLAVTIVDVLPQEMTGGDRAEKATGNQ